MINPKERHRSDGGPQSRTGARGPVISVGLPRSGSTLLSRVLNESPDLYMVDDLYFLQEVDARGAFDRLEADDAEALARFLTSKLRRRAAVDGVRRFETCLMLSPDQLEQIDAEAVRLALDAHNWADLIDRVFKRAGEMQGKDTWGYNTPQDFVHVSRLRRALPGARFIFMMRDPYAVLRSYKNVPMGRAGAMNRVASDPRRYNPLIQAASWRLAAEAFLDQTAAGADDILLVTYEQLVEETDHAVERISEFLGLTLPVTDIAALGSNTSFRPDARAQRVVTETELWLADRVLGDVKGRLGYRVTPHRPRLRDIPEVVGVAGRSGSYPQRQLFRYDAGEVPQYALARGPNRKAHSERFGSNPTRREALSMVAGLLPTINTERTGPSQTTAHKAGSGPQPDYPAAVAFLRSNHIRRGSMGIPFAMHARPCILRRKQVDRSSRQDKQTSRYIRIL